ncbi:MAG TPA: hypothetical protein VEI03_15210 [Stellaceae bacterium]|nr:hypothetical protein [Stellaceae bacterium]
MRKFSRRTIGFALAVPLLLWTALGARAEPPGGGEPVTLAAAPAGAIALGAEATRVLLAPRSAAEPFSRQLQAVGANRRLFLVLSGLQVSAQPGVVYEIYLGLPPGPVPGPGDPHYVGTLNFFGVTPLSSAQQLQRSYDVTATLTALAAGGVEGDRLAVTIVPASGSPRSGVAPPTIGRVALVAG